MYDDTTEGRKVCTYYKLDSIPVVLVIDPITGQKMRSWSGMVQPERLLEVCVMGMHILVFQWHDLIETSHLEKGLRIVVYQNLHPSSICIALLIIESFLSIVGSVTIHG